MGLDQPFVEILSITVGGCSGEPRTPSHLCADCAIRSATATMAVAVADMAGPMSLAGSMSLATADDYVMAVEDADLDPPDLMSWPSWKVHRMGAATATSEEVHLWKEVMAYFYGPEWAAELLAQNLDAEQAGGSSVQLSGNRLCAGADGVIAACDGACDAIWHKDECVSLPDVIRNAHVLCASDGLPPVIIVCGSSSTAQVLNTAVPEACCHSPLHVCEGIWCCAQAATVRRVFAFGF